MALDNMIQGMVLDFEAADGTAFRQHSVATLEAANVPAATILAAVKAHLCASIDVQAEAARARVITPGVGQSLEYQEVQAQAAAALKAPTTATEAKYPMLAATISIDIDPETGKPASDILGVARSIQAARDAWLTVGAAIRGARLGGKAAIEAAGTVEAAAEAFRAVAWPTVPEVA